MRRCYTRISETENMTPLCTSGIDRTPDSVCNLTDLLHCTHTICSSEVLPLSSPSSSNFSLLPILLLGYESDRWGLFLAFHYDREGSLLSLRGRVAENFRALREGGGGAIDAYDIVISLEIGKGKTPSP